MIALPGIDALWDALPEARIAGGAVRDSLAGRAVADVDFASPLTPDEVSRRLRTAGIKTVPTGLAHGTVTAVVGGRGFEITTLRRDVATDGRHATVAFTDDWRADAARRDFTINAMFLDRAGRIFDFFEGQADLAAGVVRFVGAADERIAEDYLRILRYFRFFARYAAGAPDAAAVAAIAGQRAGILGLSAERVWSELKKILAAQDPRAAVRLMDLTGVLALLMPGGANLEKLAGLVARGGPADAMLRVAALLAGEAREFAERLKLSAAEAACLAAYGQANGLTPAADEAAIRRALADEPAEILIARTWLNQGDGGGWDELRGRLAGPRPVFALRGRDVAALGVPPGPRVGEILHEVRQWWLAGGCVADAAACRARARALAG
jgi:poly(A) polymerase/tRNA nucleotidyltransferase (CCA-adding enzyme)